ncbi:MAG: hypothetical protein WAM44_05035 [Chthoniobacterales bacterium]
MPRDGESYCLIDELNFLAPLQLTDQVYQARGSTALLDAVGLTVDGLGENLDKTPEAVRPGKVIVAILTDGLENAGQRYTSPMVAERINHQREKYGWEFVFLAANQDAILTGAALGVDRQDCTTFAAPNSGERRRLHPDGNGWVAACVAGIARVRKIWIKCPGAEGSAAKAGG